MTVDWANGNWRTDIFSFTSSQKRHNKDVKKNSKQNFEKLKKMCYEITRQ